MFSVLLDIHSGLQKGLLCWLAGSWVLVGEKLQSHCCLFEKSLCSFVGKDVSLWEGCSLGQYCWIQMENKPFKDAGKLFFRNHVRNVIKQLSNLPASMRRKQKQLFHVFLLLTIQLTLSLKDLSSRTGPLSCTHDPQRRWRAFWSGSACCPHRPTCAPRPSPSAASHRWPPCCRTWPWGSRWNCSRRTLPQSSFCTHWSAPFDSPEIACRSVRKEESMSLGEKIQRGEFSFLANLE